MCCWDVAVELVYVCTTLLDRILGRVRWSHLVRVSFSRFGGVEASLEIPQISFQESVGCVSCLYCSSWCIEYNAI